MLFDDPQFEVWGMRALSHALYGGAEFGDCQVTASRIPDGDVDAWYREWRATGELWLRRADTCAEEGHTQSAHEGYLRAANYLRTAAPFLFDRHPSERLRDTAARSDEAFARAMATGRHPAQRVEIPIGSDSLPGWHVRFADDGVDRPLVICNNGYDSLLSELWFAQAAPALRRGYDCLLFDGPGQGASLFQRGLHLRPDWETVIAAVVDVAEELPGVDESRLTLMGWSLGGYLAPRGASGEPRLAALVCDPGQYDISGQLVPLLRQIGLTDSEIAHIDEVDDARLQPAVDYVLGVPHFEWALQRRGLMVHGLDTIHELIRQLFTFTLDGRVQDIRCPTLLGSADDDPLSASTARLEQALTCPVTAIHYTAADGAAGHCEMGARGLVHQRTFDWLDDTLGHVS